MAYLGRGDSHYELGAFTNALADYRKVCDLSPAKDYGRFRVFVMRARLGEKQAAIDELKNYLESRRSRKPEDWPAQIGRFLIGDLSESDFFKAAEQGDKSAQEDQQRAAWLYAGIKRVLDGNKAVAKDYLQKCLASGKGDAVEHKSAAAELKFLDR